MRLIDADQFGVVSFQGKSEDFAEGVAFILDKIYEAPTIEERPHGEWEACLDTEYCKCSYCGTVVMLEESVRFHFCPNCGADMRKEGESN